MSSVFCTTLLGHLLFIIKHNHGVQFSVATIPNLWKFSCRHYHINEISGRDFKVRFKICFLFLDKTFLFPLKFAFEWVLEYK